MADYISKELSAVWLVLIAAVFVSFTIQKHHLGVYMPPAGAAMLLGVLSGQILISIGWDIIIFSPDAFFYSLLPPIIFSAGLGLRNRDFFKNFGTVSVLAVLGTLISTAVVAASTFTLYRFGWVKGASLGASPLHDCLMYGALISATDTVATLSVFADLQAPQLIYNLVFGESVLNDAVSIVLFRTFQISYGEHVTAKLALSMTGKFFEISVGSVAVGIGVALIFSFVFRKLRFIEVEGSAAYNGVMYECSVMMLSAYLAYIIAEALGWSGVVALFFAGIVHNHYSLHNISVEGGKAAKDMVEVVAFLSETFVFVYLGQQVPYKFYYTDHREVDWGLVLTAVPIALVARALNIFPCTLLANLVRSKPITLAQQTMLWGAGLRGAVTYALAENLHDKTPGHGTGNEALEIAALVVVVISMLVMGPLTGPLMHGLGLKSEPTPPPSNLPFEALGPNFESTGEWLLEDDAHASSIDPRPWAGTYLGDTPTDYFGAGSHLSAGSNVSATPRERAHGIHAHWKHIDSRYLKPWFGGRLDRPLQSPGAACVNAAGVANTASDAASHLNGAGFGSGFSSGTPSVTHK